MHTCTCMASVSQSAGKRAGNAGTYLAAQASCCLLVDLERARGPECIMHRTVPLRLRGLGVTVSGDARTHAAAASTYPCYAGFLSSCRCRGEGRVGAHLHSHGFGVAVSAEVRE
jgi:hypothetical protein